MKTLIVYDSFFGNTEKIAQEIGRILGINGDVNVIKADQFNPSFLDSLDVLILGSPTRAFSASPNVKSFLNSLKDDALKGISVAAFDTRIRLEDINSKFLHFMVRLFGYAAEPILKGLVKKGGKEVVTPAWFYVNGSEGPLKDGELDRAAQWADAILAAVK